MCRGTNVGRANGADAAPSLAARDGGDPPRIGVMFPMSTPPVAVNSLSGLSPALHAVVPIVSAHLTRGVPHIWPVARLVSAVEAWIINRSARRGFGSLAVGALKLADASTCVSLRKKQKKEKKHEDDKVGECE